MRPLNLLLLFSFLVFCWPTYAQESPQFSYNGQFERINIHIAKRQGGFGDIISNIMMIERLHQDFPSAELRGIFPANEAKAIATLFPSFDPEASLQQFKGISFYSDQLEQLPLADLDLSFSNGERDRVTAPLYLSFREYSGYGSSEKWQHKFQLRGLDVSADPTYGQTAKFKLYSGIGNMGAYLSDERPKTKLSRSELIKELSKYVDGSEFDSMDQGLWGFAYAYTENIRGDYLTLINKLYGSGYFADKEIYIVMNRLGSLPAGLDPHIKVLEYDHLPFDLSKQVLANSDIPILVTGDASLTSAIEYQKFFLYEEQSWKRFSVNNLIDVVSRDNAKLDKELLSLLWKNPVKENLNISKLVKLFKRSPSLSDDLSKGLGKLRGKYSLSKNIFIFLDALSKVKFDQSFRHYHEMVFEGLYRAWSIDGSFQGLNHKLVELIDSESDYNQQLKLFKTLMSLQVDPAQGLSKKHWHSLGKFLVRVSSNSRNTQPAIMAGLLENKDVQAFLSQVIKKAKRRDRNRFLSSFDSLKNVTPAIEKDCSQQLMTLFQ